MNNRRHYYTMYRAFRPLLRQYHSKITLCKTRDYPIDTRFHPSNTQHYNNFISYISTELFSALPEIQQIPLLDVQGKLSCSFKLKKTSAGMTVGNIELVKCKTQQEDTYYTPTLSTIASREVRDFRGIGERITAEFSAWMEEVSAKADDVPLAEYIFERRFASADKRPVLEKDARVLMRTYGTMDTHKLHTTFQVFSPAAYEGNDDVLEYIKPMMMLDEEKELPQVVETDKRSCDHLFTLLALTSSDKEIAEAMFSGKPIYCACGLPAYKQKLCFPCLNKPKS